MQNSNYYPVQKDTSNIVNNSISTGNLYANFLKERKQLAQQTPQKQDQKLVGYLAEQKNLGQLSQRSQLLIQTTPNRLSQTQTTPKLNNQIVKPQIERISINFQQTLIIKQQNLLDDSSPVQDQKSLYTEKIQLYVVKIQSFYRMRLAKKSYKELSKRQRYRRSIINELVSTEKQYLSDLQFICLVQNELKQKSQGEYRIIGSQDIKSLFLNLDAIEGLSEQMVESLIVIQLKFDANTKIGNQMKQFASFFKFYFEYCNNYSLAAKLYNQLKKENPKFKDFIIRLEKTKLKGSPFEGFLIKPVQRVPKYVLLLKDLLKNTPKSHLDYDNIDDSLKEFMKVNDDNNKNMDKLITNQKIFELQKQFGNSQVMIVDAKREFKSEESVKIFYNHEARPVIVYFLTDLVLVTEREEKDSKFTYKLLKYIYLDQYSYGQELDDSAHISFLFRLIGKNETVTFIADNSENKQRFIDYINNLINGIRVLQANRQQAFEVFDKSQVKGDRTNQQQKYPILVKVLGTQEVYESQVKTFTQYIISIEIANIVQKIFIRFSHFLEIQKKIQTQFPNLKLPYCKDQSWIGNHDVKVIEGRKIQMMNFLQTLLTSEQMPMQGQEILTQFGLPPNFYQLPEFLDQQPQQNQEYLNSYRKKPTSSHQNSARTSVFQSYFNIGGTDLGKSGIKVMGLQQIQAPQVYTPRQPVKGQHDEYYNKSNKGSPQKQVSQKQVNVSQIPSQMESTTQFASRSNSQQMRKYSATKLARGSLPINSANGSLVRNESKKEIQLVKIRVQILTYPKPTEIEITIVPDSRGTDAFDDVMLQVNLQIDSDFKLYIKEQNSERPIENDELLWTLLVERQTVQSTTQKLTQLVKRVTAYVYSYNQKPIILKKHLYLPEEIEREYYEDTKRVELLAQQTLMEITNNQLKLNDTEYTMVTALKLYLDGVKNIQLDRIPLDKIQEFLPMNVFKSLPKDNWQYLLPDLLTNFEDEVKSILQEHCSNKINPDSTTFSPNRGGRQADSTGMESNKHSRQLTVSDFEDDPEIIRLSIGQMVFLKLISQTQFYGYKVFELTPDKETRINLQKVCQDQFREYLSGMGKSAQNQVAPQVTGVKIILCIGYSSINIYSNFKQTRPLVSLKYSDISQVKAHPLSLLIYLQQELAGTSFQIKKSILLHFDTGQSFVIQMLIQEYQDTRQTMEQQDQYDFTQIE